MNISSFKNFFFLLKKNYIDKRETSSDILGRKENVQWFKDKHKRGNFLKAKG